ncbi:hypothetical protein AB0I35_30430 [Nocardia sp. NPDC050378]|uniref:hypothetical protein n=1 Tax=Nocardia sp. NPDC050378 TaxID=3155400 RepID=UPI0033C1B1AE
MRNPTVGPRSVPTTTSTRSTADPGIEGTHEKGGVEKQIGWFRRNHFIPIPEVESIDELNELVDAWDIADEQRRIGARPRTIGELFAAEKPLLKPLPDEPPETGRWFTPRVDKFPRSPCAPTITRCRSG